MPSPSSLTSWDIFCTVIDNYGDIGVCWRLARQLQSEHALQVRLWVDDLAAFQRICPEINSQANQQYMSGIEIRRWQADFPDTAPGDVVIEAFACHLPERFIEAMARREPKPVWINLDYLSAEDWVSGCHALPSPQPRLPLTKYFYFPGFTKKTGGLLRESRLEEQRLAFCHSGEQQSEFWQEIKQVPPADDRLKVSLFSYENPILIDLLRTWQCSATGVTCFAPVTRTRAAIETFAGHAVKAGDLIRRGNLEIRMLPFVAQSDYDRLLWSCDINFVRGEDSFVRAQWAAKPMVWHIYPQDDGAHRAKLAAFLERYCAGLSEVAAQASRDLVHFWNGTTQEQANHVTTKTLAQRWEEWMKQQSELRLHADKWANNLKKQDDLCSSLVRFCRSKL